MRKIYIGVLGIMLSVGAVSCGHQPDIQLCNDIDRVGGVIDQQNVRPMVKAELLQDVEEMSAQHNCPGSDPSNLDED